VAYCSTRRAQKRRKDLGFSLVELLVSVIILVVLAAIAVPTLLRAYHAYQLGDAASRLSGIMKTTRFSAVRKNTPISCQVVQNGTTWTIWTDLDGDGTAETTEPQILLSGLVQLLDDSAVPAPNAITAALATGSAPLNTLSTGNATVWYDQRGARGFGTAPSFGGPTTIDVFYLGNPAIPDLEFRAVVLLPGGSVQVWSAGPGGTWQRIN